MGIRIPFHIGVKNFQRRFTNTTVRMGGKGKDWILSGKCNWCKVTITRSGPIRNKVDHERRLALLAHVNTCPVTKPS